MSDRTKSSHDFVIVGSGINSLVCAALLAKAGHDVLVLERNDRLGGCIRSEELFPGYVHDILSSSYPLFTTSPGYEALGDDLHGAGLEFANNDLPTAIVTDDGRSLIMSTDPKETARRFNQVKEGEGDKFTSVIEQFFAENADLTFGLLGNELRSTETVKLLAKELWSRKIRGTVKFAGEALESCRDWVERDFESDLVRGLIAPWVLHAGLGPDDTYSGLMGKVIMGAVGMAGMPVVVGGSQNFLDAFVNVIEGNGGTLLTDTDVARVLVENGAATGVDTADGRTFRAREAVIANVTPTQLYGRLIESPPPEVAEKAAAYRYGRADMQLHYALAEVPQWPDDDLARVAYVHVTSGLDGVARAVTEARSGFLPNRATIVVGQPVALDPGRAPEGGWTFWIQLQELPSNIQGDATGEIDIPPGGEWGDEVRDAYIERIERRLADLIPNFRQSIVGRRAYTPADLESINMNLVGGDPYSGSCTLDQFLLWRPLPNTKNHETPIDNLFHIGASTHPGPGLGGNSGFMVAGKFT